ncbi:transposase [Psittacicella hinzii]|uniref:Transposase IS4-like domain-containing protein n=1 Tax=Psittacicella hinzii TaxID=2028575 RepID=A0A3A1YRL5_9GAMM|nr:transposase [Psittacicella hinzii]RIY39828.1 hypothetical protein CKF58_01560 [Psittacicella hinzii]
MLNERAEQINLALLINHKSKLPMFYEVYTANVNDKTYLPYLISKWQEIYHSPIYLVMDQGSLNETYFFSLDKMNIKFISTMSKDLKE